MLQFPNAKINLGLYITEKRSDGYHNLETVFVPVPWYDALEIVRAEQTSLQVSGHSVTGNPEDNLVMKVYRRMASLYDLPPVSIILQKNIPMGAGLGGGSADAAFAARMLSDLFQLQLSTETLESLVRPLGSDCAFFIRNKATFAYEKGDQFEAIAPINFPAHIVMVYPRLHVSTAQAYGGVQASPAPFDLRKSIQEAPSRWKDLIHNDFEKSVFLAYPELADIKSSLYRAGAVYATMSGSGSTVVGLFEEEPVISFPSHYLVQQGRMNA
ncbi:MAG: 4-(cytidine 5'-diphospho)-2-C-methyl-D-erythritol kinase [Cytophagaceae bacterium]|jgi:4-diphosphocytidyl-2-C-methyl-D-erythritol kinase|nr:4-(cytidine 5'-diphospho)-2-C-methyl-D-erythritol kinase [Cytophagaceae bacterium]